jgi:thioredoxin 2
MIIRVCPKCGKQNRIPAKHVADVGKCGNCKTALPPSPGPIDAVDTEAHPDLATRYQVASIPNFMVFKGGKAVMRQAGLVPSAEMRRWIEQAMSAAA